MFLNTLRNKKETQLFDYIGTSMWGINDLLENDFAGLTDASHYSVQKVVRNQPPMPVHALYNLRFLHDGAVIHRGALVPTFAQQLSRRATRFVETIRTSRNILFVRHQEKSDLIWKSKEYSNDELGEVQRFATLLRTKFGIQQFKIAYINREHEGVIDDHIVCFRINRPNGNAKSMGSDIKEQIRRLSRAKN
jgi:hypothetical protein